MVVETTPEGCMVVDTTTKSHTIGTTVLGRCIVEKGDLVGEGFVAKRVWDKDVVMDGDKGMR